MYMLPIVPYILNYIGGFGVEKNQLQRGNLWDAHWFRISNQILPPIIRRVWDLLQQFHNPAGQKKLGLFAPPVVTFDIRAFARAHRYLHIHLAGRCVNQFPNGELTGPRSYCQGGYGSLKGLERLAGGPCHRREDSYHIGYYVVGPFFQHIPFFWWSSRLCLRYRMFEPCSKQSDWIYSFIYRWPPWLSWPVHRT